MWKYILLFCLFIAMCFMIPSFFIDFNSINNEKIKIVSGDVIKKESGDVIKLLLSESNQVVTLSMNDYIKGVLLGEMPVTYELEALKAQAIVARTYTMYKLKNNPNIHENANMCDDINCCQAYKTKEYAFSSWDDNEEQEKWRKLEDAVNQTSNLVITYSGEIIEAFFHAHSGGKTENIKYVWGDSEIPYLKSVDGNEGENYQDSKTFTKSEFKELLSEKIPQFNVENSKIKIEDYTGSGRVNNLKINDVEIKATELRKMIGIKSTNFRIEESGEKITFYTVGYGHGVGMSQYGANQMAKEGKTCEEIIKHYYTGVEINKI